MDFHKDLGPKAGDVVWNSAAARLRESDRTRIAHIDSGLFSHPALGFQGEEAPANIALDLGRNFYDPEFSPFGEAPLTDLRKAPGPLGGLLEYPDHGVKTLSVILADTEKLKGIAPGATVIPYRVSNGPLFRDGRGPMMRDQDATATIGQAIDHALGLEVPPRVVSISMGNPGVAGPFHLLVALLDGSAGMHRSVGEAIARAYARGVIVVCAAGQVIDRIVYPARYPQTIAVGGYDETGQDRVHYPLGGYAAPDPVDVWTRAVRINRASGRRPGEGDEIEADPDGIARVYAEDDPKFAGNASGTSYAAAQVAAAAALWSEHWHDRLTRAPFDGAPWKRVEAFRAALRALPEERISNGRALGGSVRVRRLDVEALLNREPGTDAPLERRPDRGRGFF